MVLVVRLCHKVRDCKNLKVMLRVNLTYGWGWEVHKLLNFVNQCCASLTSEQPLNQRSHSFFPKYRRSDEKRLRNLRFRALQKLGLTFQ
jgi:hypothetical protein